jgi:hypothetical protein
MTTGVNVRCNTILGCFLAHGIIVVVSQSPRNAAQLR